MRKKIIIGIAASLFAVAGLFGVNSMNQSANSDISLSSIAMMAQAQAETFSSYQTMGYCDGWSMTWCCTSRKLSFGCSRYACTC